MGFLTKLIFGRSVKEILESIETKLFELWLGIEGLEKQLNKLERKHDMSQETFDEQMAQLNSKLDGIRTALTNEAGEIATVKDIFETRIAELKQQLEECKGESVDTSALNDAIATLGDVQERISNLVAVPRHEEPPQPVEDVPLENPTEELPPTEAPAPAEEVPAESPENPR